MDNLRQTYCDRCKALIVFIRTEGGKYMPCDVNPVPYREDASGETSVFTRFGKRIRCTLNCSKEDCSGYGYIPHWGSCISYEGRKRLDAYKEQTRQRATPDQTMKAFAARPQPMKEEPKYEQMCLFGGERRYRHPV